MLSLIIDELNEAVGHLWEDDWTYAYHTGKAGGIACAIGARCLYNESFVRRNIRCIRAARPGRRRHLRLR